VDTFCARLDACAAGDEAFTLLLDDPAGNSAIEWFGEGNLAGGSDPQLKRDFYERSRADNVAIGCMTEDQKVTEEERERAAYEERSFGKGAPKLGCTIAHSDGANVMSLLSRYSAPEEVMVFPGGCPGCRGTADTRMFATQIPYFREVVVMCTSCEACGYRNSDLRCGGGIPAMGRSLSLSVSCVRDLSRDIIKSETAEVLIPELDLELGCGTLGGRVTTVEGLLCEVRDALQRTSFSTLGDSALARDKNEWDSFFSGLEDCITGSRRFTLVLRDPLAASYIASDTADPTADPTLRSEDFMRSYDEDEEFGLHDMCTGDEGDPSQAGYHVGEAAQLPEPTPEEARAAEAKTDAARAEFKKAAEAKHAAEANAAA